MVNECLNEKLLIRSMTIPGASSYNNDGPLKKLSRIPLYIQNIHVRLDGFLVHYTTVSRAP